MGRMPRAYRLRAPKKGFINPAARDDSRQVSPLRPHRVLQQFEPMWGRSAD
jgi:hypothetical protein